MARDVRNPGLAAVLSLIVPGVGQFYTGHFIWGIFWLLVTAPLWVGTGGCFGWIAHIFAAMQAYWQAENHNLP